MLEGIKSIFFRRLLFSYLDEKTKLEIVKYNKELQNQIQISLINYKFLSHRYIVFETKTKGKEYDYIDDEIKFEGEYLNGKRNGKGIEYYDEYYGRRKFEGEYLNGKRNGKGNEYDNSGDLIFQGEYINGRRNGKGIEFYVDKKKSGDYDYITKFEGEYLNGKKWNGKCYDADGNFINEIKEGKGYIKEYENIINKIKFEDEYLNGERNGKGKDYYLYGELIFEGEYFNGKKWNGKGYNLKKKCIYEIKNGKGLVKILRLDGTELVGEYEYIHGEKNGKGREYDSYPTTLIFEGEYLNGKRNGKGKEYYRGNLLFEGEYLYGYRLNGKEYFLNGKLEYEGEYLYNKKYNGKGYNENNKIIYTLKNGNGKIKEYLYGKLSFEGEYLNGKRNGKGKEYVFDELSFEGEYLNGKRNGKGKEFNNGLICYEGEYANGRRKY